MFDSISRTRSIAIVAAACAAMAACKGKESAAGASTGATAGMSAGATGAAAAGGTAAGAIGTATPSYSDANIVAILDEANQADIEAGRLAETKGTSKDVKDFGRLMVGEHGGLLAQTKQVAQQQHITAQAPANDSLPAEAKAAMDSLRSMPKGAAWDRAYIDHEVGFHQKVIDVANKLHDQAQNQALKGLIEQAGPVLQKHLQKAQQVQQKLGSSTT